MFDDGTARMRQFFLIFAGAPFQFAAFLDILKCFVLVRGITPRHVRRSG